MPTTLDEKDEKAARKSSQYVLLSGTKLKWKKILRSLQREVDYIKRWPIYHFDYNGYSWKHSH